GNVRELKNIIERCLIESGGDTVRLPHLRLSPRAGRGPAQPAAPAATLSANTSGTGADPAADLPLNLEEAEALLIKRALAETGGNIAEAARRLGVNRTRIYRKMSGQA
ncbi:MAG: two component response regulator protein, partial [Phycisphaerales bacterium]|nr:two component response regulator protein [Phycisphaerales bacterium]